MKLSSRLSHRLCTSLLLLSLSLSCTTCSGYVDWEFGRKIISRHVTSQAAATATATATANMTTNMNTEPMIKTTNIPLTSDPSTLTSAVATKHKAKAEARKDSSVQRLRSHIILKDNNNNQVKSERNLANDKISIYFASDVDEDAEQVRAFSSDSYSSLSYSYSYSYSYSNSQIQRPAGDWGIAQISNDAMTTQDSTTNDQEVTVTPALTSPVEEDWLESILNEEQNYFTRVTCAWTESNTQVINRQTVQILFSFEVDITGEANATLTVTAIETIEKSIFQAVVDSLLKCQTERRSLVSPSASAEDSISVVSQDITHVLTKKSTLKRRTLQSQWRNLQTEVNNVDANEPSLKFIAIDSMPGDKLRQNGK